MAIRVGDEVEYVGTGHVSRADGGSVRMYGARGVVIGRKQTKATIRIDDAWRHIVGAMAEVDTASLRQLTA